MRSFINKHGKLIALLIAVAFSLMLLVSAVTMLSSYKKEIAERTSSKGQYYTLLARNYVENGLEDNVEKAVGVATHISELNNIDDVIIYLTSLPGSSNFEDVAFTRYFNANGELISETSDIYTDISTDISVEYYENTPLTSGYVGTFNQKISATEQLGTKTMFGFYAPVYNSEIVKGVVIYFQTEKLKNLYSDYVKNDLAIFSALCDKNGVIINYSGTGLEENNDILYSIKKLTASQKAENDVTSLLNNGTDGTVLANVNSKEHLITVGADKSVMKDLAVIEMYEVGALYQTSFEFVYSIIAIIILFACIAIGLILYLIFKSIRQRNKILMHEEIDEKLNCLKRAGFEKEAMKILDRNTGSNFAIVVMSLRHYRHILEDNGESEVNRLVEYFNLTVSKTIQMEEAYGHIEGGRFVMLLHAKDRNGVLERLKVQSFLATQYKGSHKFDILLKYGIYEIIGKDTTPISQMIDFALDETNNIKNGIMNGSGIQFNFYDDELRKIRLINEDMELRMEGALKNGEFQVFYQPKYNLSNNRQDGAEALVRWYDPKKDVYNRPNLFMALFEANGFVIKLDKYIYTRVCEYISYSISHGKTVYPISVNISRVTAIQTDFVEYYTSIKKKYSVPDGLIMIEFTESFAYENYETLGGIVEKLHKNGFSCSIDDFGCGYSSYKILKSLPMDEIKLDKFFLEKTKDETRDNHIFESIISLAKSLNMKVTQEGVESKEDVDKLRKLNCDVVQGYLYSRPLSLSDYMNFVDRTKEHDLD